MNSGIDSINSGPIILRTYNDSKHISVILGDYDIPVPPNRVLITSMNGVITPSDNIYVSTISSNDIRTNSIMNYSDNDMIITNHNGSTYIDVPTAGQSIYLSTVGNLDISCYNIILHGAHLQSTSSGFTSGKYLNVTLNNIPYKIELFTY
jgi:hypothetical protein